MTAEALPAEQVVVTDNWPFIDRFDLLTSDLHSAVEPRLTQRLLRQVDSQTWVAFVPLTEREISSLGKPDRSNPIYPVTYRFDLRDISIGEEIIAVRLMECEASGNFSVVSFGEIVAPSPRRPQQDTEASAGTEQMERVKLTGSLAVMNYYDASGDAWDFFISSRSYNHTDIWCIPEREFCTKSVHFNAYGLKGRAGSEFLLPRSLLFSRRWGLMLTLQGIVTQLCGITSTPDCVDTLRGPAACVQGSKGQKLP